ncbi:MAG: MFS transporter [Akkermansiaceae bacterium]
MSTEAESGQQQGKTFRLELLRSLPQGFIETSGATFSMFIAIRVFDAPDALKMAIAAAASVGLLLSLFTVQFVRRLGCSVNIASAWVWTMSAVGFSIAALSGSSVHVYLTGVCMAAVFLALGVPLMSQIYRKHYSDTVRGKLFSLSAMSRSVIAGMAGLAIGVWLTENGVNFHLLFWCYAGCTLAMAACVLGMSKVKLRKAQRLRLFDAFEHVGKDAAFRKLLISWMMLGLGNLLCFALFVEYISNPKYGFELNAARAGLITSSIPMMAFIVCVVPWGMVFDKLPFYSVRVLINVFFFAGILIFYLGGNYISLCVGIALHGIGRSGGNVIWSLWVTRFTDADKVGEYMSVHTSLTGLRGTIAPVIAFSVAGLAGPHIVAIAGGLLIVMSSLMLLPEVKREFRAKKNT